MIDNSSSNIKALKDHAGWLELEKYLHGRRLEYMNKILKTDPNAIPTIAGYQERIKLLDLIINKVNN